jgi:pimeloyl-ACP methyl ester carboxylesterase
MNYSKKIIRGLEYSFIDTDTAADKHTGACADKHTCSDTSATTKATILLLHGFPDLAYGWRFQIPSLSRNGFRVIAPDMVGYGETETAVDLERYSFKSVVLDFIELIDCVVGKGEI